MLKIGLKIELRDRVDEIRQLNDKVRELQSAVARMQQLQSELTAAKAKIDDFDRSLVPSLRNELRDAKLTGDDLARRVRELEALVADLRQWEPKYSQLKIENDR